MALITFAAGFAVRPLGALGLALGRHDRTQTYLLDPIVILALAALWALALIRFGCCETSYYLCCGCCRASHRGEYGGAATYVAEHAPPGKRGYYTSWIQTTATFGMIMSLMVIVACRWIIGPEFDVWGWRIPFVISIILLAVSVYIRLQLEESPVFTEMRSKGKLSKAPLSESFLKWGNLKVVLLSLFGAVAGQAVIAYCGLAYMAIYLEQTLKVDPSTTNLMVAGALAACTPFFVIFGKLSDRIGRKKLVAGGCLLGALLMFPVFKALVYYATPGISAAQLEPYCVGPSEECSFQFAPAGVPFYTSEMLLRRDCARGGHM